MHAEQTCNSALNYCKFYNTHMHMHMCNDGAWIQFLIQLA